MRTYRKFNISDAKLDFVKPYNEQIKNVDQEFWSKEKKILGEKASCINEVVLKLTLSGFITDEDSFIKAYFYALDHYGTIADVSIRCFEGEEDDEYRVHQVIKQTLKEGISYCTGYMFKNLLEVAVKTDTFDSFITSNSLIRKLEDKANMIKSCYRRYPANGWLGQQFEISQEFLERIKDKAALLLSKQLHGKQNGKDIVNFQDH